MTADQIRRLRDRLGWSQSQMGRYLGVSAASVHRWEAGQSRPDDYRLATLVQLKRRLDEFESEQRRQRFIEGLATAAVTGGIIALLSFLFNSDEDPTT